MTREPHAMPLILKEEPFPGCHVGVWHLTESYPELESGSGLPSADLDQVRSFGHELRKRQWIACRRVLTELGIPFPLVSYDSAGKPFLEGSGVHISFSHSGNYAAAACSRDYRIGVDIEIPRQRIFRVADRFLHPEELASIAEPFMLEKLCIYWCAKEAVFKLNGKPGVDFMKDLILEPFDYLCTGRGNGRVLLKKGELLRHYPLWYLKEEGFVLVITAGIYDKPVA
jgi:4'-phosphopantetheinyl transferase